MRSHDQIGGAICASFLVFGGLSVLVYKPWRRRVDRMRPVGQPSNETDNRNTQSFDHPIIKNRANGEGTKLGYEVLPSNESALNNLADREQSELGRDVEEVRLSSQS